jgi:ATP-dependent exoDNAse (exonuclease V) beta subunit
MRVLTDEQAAAVERRHDATLLDAGAGSGKTTVLVERFLRAVRDDGVDPRAILAITFTNKAADELRARVRAALHDAGLDEAARATDDGWISTIDAFCTRVLRAHALEAGLDPRFSVLEPDLLTELSGRAIDQALAEIAETASGSELIAAHRLGDLAQATLSTYDELRSRGQRRPALPAMPVLVGTVAERVQALNVAAAAFATELAAINNPGATVVKALAALEGALELTGDPLPWPGDLAPLAVKGGGNALQTDACASYKEALTALSQRIAGEFAGRQRDALDALLRAYGVYYEAAKQARGAVDFADLELLARDLLGTAEIGDRYRERFSHVMVDELQDSSALQHELVTLVTGPDTVLFMVGDAQQSIYGFRHAEVELFEERGRELSELGGRLSLQTNFRSRPEILEVLNAGFGAVMGEGFRGLRAGVPETDPTGHLVDLLIVDKGVDWSDDDEVVASPWRVVETRVLADHLAGLISDGECVARDVVVLTRAGTDLRMYERALEAAGVPTFVVGGRGYWRHPQVVELVAYLRALANPLDQEPFWVTLCSPLCGLTLDGLVLLAAGARDQLDPADAAKLASFEQLFTTERAQARRLGPAALLDRVIEQTGYDLSVITTNPDGRRRLANVRKLMRLAGEFEASAGPDLHGFIALLNRRIAAGGAGREAEAPVESDGLDAVRLMTIHSSKGLEFPVVCVADLGRAPFVAHPLIRIGSEGTRLGLRLARAGTGAKVQALHYNELKEEALAADLAEQQRLFYVAMTRAQRRLILSGATKLAKLGELKGSPMDWIAPAFKDLPGVRTRLIVEHPVREIPPTGAKVTQDEAQILVPPPPIALPAAPAVDSVSYSGLSGYLKCPLRFYAERVIGLPPTPVSGSSGGRERGTRLHEALATIDLRLPATDPELQDLLASPTYARIARAREVRREQPFAFVLGELLITGTFDVLATETDGRTLVVDYKSDALNDQSPEQLVALRYETQRLIYALAALRINDADVEVVHLFLDAPEHPATSIYKAAARSTVEAELIDLTASLRAGDFAPAADPRRSLCAGCPAAGGICPYPLALTERQAPDRLF